MNLTAEELHPALQESPVVQLPSTGPAPTEDPVYSFRWGWYALSVMIPFAGILLGIFLYDQPERPARRVGRNSLLIGFILWVVLPLAVALMLLILVSMSAVGWLSSLMPPTA